MDGATFLWHIYFLSLAGIDRYMSVNLPGISVAEGRCGRPPQSRRIRLRSAPEPAFFSDVSREKLRFGAGTDMGIRSAGCAGSF